MKIKGLMAGMMLAIMIFSAIGAAQEVPINSTFFTLFGQVFDVGGTTPVNGAQVSLTIGGVTKTTTTATNIRGEPGVYQFELANFPMLGTQLSGANEVPPVSATQASGQVVFALSNDGNTLHFKLNVANIVDTTASHIHLAPAGVNGPIVVPLFLGPTKAGAFTGVLGEGDITAANLTGLLAGQPLSVLISNMTGGNTYVNVHTLANPGGEIRGQIAPMTLSAATVGKSATRKVLRAINEPQRVDITLALGGGLAAPPAPPGNGGGGGTSPGGGGGGGASGENFSNVEVREKYDEAIFKDRVTSYKFKNASNPITQVDVMGNVNAGLITAMVEVLRGTSTLVSEAPPGVVNKNVNLWLGTSGFATPKNLKEVIIRFRVENGWMQSNNVDAKDVKLLRWDGATWTTLETTVKEKDGTVTFFEAKTNALSPLAISAVVTQPGGPVAGGPAATPPAPGLTPPQGTPKPKAPGFEIAAGIAAISVLYVLCRKIRR